MAHLIPLVESLRNIPVCFRFDQPFFVWDDAIEVGQVRPCLSKKLFLLSSYKIMRRDDGKVRPTLPKVVDRPRRCLLAPRQLVDGTDVGDSLSCRCFS